MRVYGLRHLATTPGEGIALSLAGDPTVAARADQMLLNPQGGGTAILGDRGRAR